jgi:hypothetical protein
MYLGCVISGFARGRWLRSFENISYRSYRDDYNFDAEIKKIES